MKAEKIGDYCTWNGTPTKVVGTLKDPANGVARHVMILDEKTGFNSSGYGGYDIDRNFIKKKVRQVEISELQKVAEPFPVRKIQPGDYVATHKGYRSHRVVGTVGDVVLAEVPKTNLQSQSLSDAKHNYDDCKNWIDVPSTTRVFGFLTNEVHLAEMVSDRFRIGDMALAPGEAVPRKVVGHSEKKVCLEGGAKGKPSKYEADYAFYIDESAKKANRTWYAINDVSLHSRPAVKFAEARIFGEPIFNKTKTQQKDDGIETSVPQEAAAYKEKSIKTMIKKPLQFIKDREMMSIDPADLEDLAAQLEELVERMDKKKEEKEDSFKEDLIDAGYRLAADRLLRLTKMAMMAALTPKINIGQSTAFRSLLETKLGEGGVAMTIGYTLTKLMKSNSDKRLKRLLKEFRVMGLTKVGGVVIDSAVDKMMPIVIDAISSLPQPENNVRIASKNKEGFLFEELPAAEEEEEEVEVMVPKAAAA